MKINGKKVSGPNKVITVLPREGGDLAFVAQAVLDSDEFEKLVPRPAPPLITRKGDSLPSPDYTDKKYVLEDRDYGKKKTNWMIIKSLSATPGLEYEQVNVLDPSTWHLIYLELKDAGLCEMEIGRLVNSVWEAHALDESKLDAARERFLASQGLLPETL
jgi:hypothetical protein